MSLPRSELAQREHLALAVVEGPVSATGVAAVADLQARADAAVEDEHVRHQIGHLLRGCGDYVDRQPGVLVSVGTLKHLRVEPRQHPGEHARGHALQVAHGTPASISPTRRRTASAQSSVEPRRAEAQVLPEVAKQTPPGDHPRLVGRAREEDAGGAGHQGPVEVEERRGARGRRVAWAQLVFLVRVRAGGLCLQVVGAGPPSRRPRVVLRRERAHAGGTRLRRGRSPRRPGRRRSRSPRSRGHRRGGAAPARASRGCARRRRRSGGRARRRRR